MKASSVQWLFLNQDEYKLLSSARNRQRWTPLEALQEQLDLKRSMNQYGFSIVVISHSFTGFSVDAVKTLLPLKNATNSTQSEKLQA